MIYRRTSLALNFSIVPSTFSFLLKIHLQTRESNIIGLHCFIKCLGIILNIKTIGVLVRDLIPRVLQDHILRDSGICGMDDDYVSALAYLRAQQTLASALFSEMVKDIEAYFDMIVRQKAVFECLRAPHAQDFLLAILIDGLDQHMSPVEYRTILKYRLMIPLFLVDAICLVFRKAYLDSFGEHAIHCKELSGFKYQHDMVRDVLFYICRHAGISAKKEAPVNFLTDLSDERSTLRPADVLVFGWVGGKHACVDLTRISPCHTPPRRKCEA
ncbi:hypothetical protein Tco_0162867 [Tanacetum coccineum]